VSPQRDDLADRSLQLTFEKGYVDGGPEEVRVDL
jgi:hypothetical protein